MGDNQLFNYVNAERAALTVSSLIRSFSYNYKTEFCLVHRLILRKVILLFFAKERYCYHKDSAILVLSEHFNANLFFLFNANCWKYLHLSSEFLKLSSIFTWSFLHSLAAQSLSSNCFWYCLIGKIIKHKITI